MGYYKSVSIPVDHRQLELDDIVMRLSGNSLRQQKTPKFSLTNITYIEAEPILAKMANQNFYVSDMQTAAGIIGKLIYFNDDLTYAEFMLLC